MKITENKIYFCYILLGSLYFVFKAIWYVCGLVYFRGVIFALIATVLTVLAGAFSFREYKKTDKILAHRLMMLLPLMIIPLTPGIMIYNLGLGIFQPEKITILLVFELLATTQLILAVLRFKGLREKQKRKQ